MTEKRCWDVIVDALQKEKVGFLFGLPGHPAALYNSIYDASGIETVLVRHKTSGVFMAMAYARFTRQPGVL